MTISFKEFKKIEVKIGTIIEASRVLEADKLVRLVIDFGSEKRQIMAGIAPFYPNISALIGKQVPVVVNLEPKTLRGYESQGMILAADHDGRPILLHPDDPVPAGSIVR